MYHAPPRNVRLRRKIGFLLLTWIIVIGGVILLTALTLGYGFDRENGQLEQSGILQIGSRPGNAKVTLNDQPLSSSTPAKVVSSPGDYAIRLEQSGYRTWQKTVPIKAGGLTWATYPRLIPEDLSSRSVLTLPETLSDALPSPSSKYYAFLPVASDPRITIATINSDKVTESEIKVPSDTVTKPDPQHPNSTYAIELWSGDEQKILLSHTYGADNTVEWILLDRTNPEESQNLSRLFAVAMKEVTFANDDGSRLYALVDGAVRLLNVSNETLGRPLVEKVAEYELFEDNYIFFVSEPTEQETQQIGYVRDDYKKPRVIDVVPYDGENSALFSVGKFYDKYYFLTAHGKEATLSKSNSLSGDNSTSLKRTLVTSMQLERPITDAHITRGGQFATIQDGRSFTTHNLETGQTTPTELLAAKDGAAQKLRYLETQLLWAEHDGKLRTYEFDGANQHDIMPIEARFSATFSPQGKYLYGVQKSDEGYELVRMQFLDLPKTK